MTWKLAPALAAGCTVVIKPSEHAPVARLRAGTVWVNAYRVVAPSVPFGGYKASGMGRENGIEAVHVYTENKSVWVELSGGTRDPFTLG